MNVCGLLFDLEVNMEMGGRMLEELVAFAIVYLYEMMPMILKKTKKWEDMKNEERRREMKDFKLVVFLCVCAWSVLAMERSYDLHDWIAPLYGDISVANCEEYPIKGNLN